MDGVVSPVPREARAFQGHRAGLVSRLIANSVDGVVVTAVLLGGYGLLKGVLFLLGSKAVGLPSASIFLSAFVAFGTVVIYLAGSWMITGRTYGDHVMGLRVVNFRGNRLRPVGALLRALFCAFFPIGLAWCAVSRECRSVQDLVLRTSVIYDWQPTPQRPVVMPAQLTAQLPGPDPDPGPAES